jgi:MFS family permease
MWSPYRAVLARTGARRLALSCAVAWLSFCGYSLGLVLAVHAGTGSFAVAGIAVAAFAAGSGLIAPVRGRLIDRRGPAMLRPLAAAHGLALGLVVVSCAAGTSAALPVAGSAAAGISAPPLIATARALWVGVAGPGLAGTAHALNAALADAAQIVSPALTGGLAALVSPPFALGLLAAGAGLAAALIAGSERAGDRGDERSGERRTGDQGDERSGERRTGDQGDERSEDHRAVDQAAEPGGDHSAVDQAAEPGGDRCATARGAEPGADQRPSGRRVWGALSTSPGLRTIVAGELLCGLWLGALEITVIAIAAARGSAELAGVTLSVSALGSMGASLWSGAHRGSAAASTRYLGGTLVVAVALPLTLAAPSMAGITATLAVVGAGFGLLNVAVFELIERVVGPDRAVEAFTWLTTWQGLGVAVGAAAAGQLAKTDATSALLLAAAAPAVGALVAVIRRRTLIAGAEAAPESQGIRTILPRVWRAASSRKASRT